MFVYRIVKSAARTTDLSGAGAYRSGGRWNSKGTYMLYTNETSSLAYLETLVHFEEDLFPPRLYLMKILVSDKASIYTLKETDYPPAWMRLENNKTKALGSHLMKEGKYLAVKIKSAVNPTEHNYVFNPLFPRFASLVKVVDVSEIKIDGRLM